MDKDAEQLDPRNKEMYSVGSRLADMLDVMANACLIAVKNIEGFIEKYG